MKQTRAFLRYRVAELNELKGELEGIRLPLRLATFGQGGCGFFATEKNAALIPPKRLFCSFSLNQSDPIKVQGNLRYVQVIGANGKTFFYIGIEFIEPHRPMLEPIVHGLERLKSEGRVSEA